MKVSRALSIVLLVGVAVASASASQLQFNGTGSNSYNGVASYPYSFTVDGTSNVLLMCVGFNEHITPGETWQATEMTVSDYIKYLGGTPADTTKAEELAYLYTLALAGHGSNPAINAEAWFINEGQPAPEPDAALLAGFAPGSYSTVRVYVPTSDQTGWTNGVPQTFLGSTPEPGTLLTLGTGLVGLAGLARKLI